MRGKQGLSTVVTTLIIILLVLVAIGIIWTVVKNVITGSGEQIDINTRCVTTNLEISSAACTIASPSVCTVTMNKGGGYALDGIRIVFANDTQSGTAISQVGDIVVSQTFTGLSSGIGVGTANTNVTVKVAGYFNDAQGVAVSCPGVSEAEVTIA